ncbi:MAG: MoaD/ThiS family protein [Pseudobdellovibrionaceae bacterium]
MKQIKIKLFGAFKKYVPKGNLSLEISEIATVHEVRQLIENKIRHDVPSFQDASLIHESAMASSEDILQETDLVFQYDELAILPPVCGG